MSKDSLGDRCKRYEDVFRQYLPSRIPKIIRIDGKAFHSILRKAQKPYDKNVVDLMLEATRTLMQEIGGTARFAYIQSDEISIALNDYLDLKTSAWFDNNVQKIVSVSSAIVSAVFTKWLEETTGLQKPYAAFDARVFVVPEADLNNVFLWRQQDATRNSVQSYTRSMYSQKQMHGMNNAKCHDMMMEKGFNWNDAPTWTKRGVVLKRVSSGLEIDWEIPVFSEDKTYLESYFYPVDENADEAV